MIRYLLLAILIAVCITIPSCMLVQHTKVQVIKHLTLSCYRVQGQCLNT